jgi:hypothetical protein
VTLVGVHRAQNQSGGGDEWGIGAGAIDRRLELAVAYRFFTCVNFAKWLAALDDFRNWLIREAA